jgi:quinoprotein dehydrogenase-associated probable ABC transporter substrate-binding protein
VLLSFALLATAQARELRVCADPDNVPFSNQKLQGFENHIAELLARDLHAHLVYQWQRMGRGFTREFLGKSRCDLLIGIPSHYPGVLATSPYYRSSFVFVERRDHLLGSPSLNNAALHNMKIGVQVLDEDYTPPAAALARRGMSGNIVGFETTGDEASSIIRAVASGKVDTAIVWGPLAGYFARAYGNRLQIVPIQPEVDPPGLPFTFEISMGVRKGNTALRDELEQFLQRRRTDIQKILRQYGVPQLAMAQATGGK